MSTYSLEDITRFFYLFLGTSIAFVIGSALYTMILSLTDNILMPSVIKLLKLSGIDTSKWEYNKFKWLEFSGDILTFSIALLLTYLLYIYFGRSVKPT